MAMNRLRHIVDTVAHLFKYAASGKDLIEKLEDWPQPNSGAPLPRIWSDELRLIVTYITRDHRYGVIDFRTCFLLKFGLPNDEALHGHSLYSRGLKPYCMQRVRNSSWLSAAERANSVHRYHKRSEFLKGKEHYVLAFHDSILECLVKTDGENAITVKTFSTPMEAMACQPPPDVMPPW